MGIEVIKAFSFTWIFNILVGGCPNLVESFFLIVLLKTNPKNPGTSKKKILKDLNIS
jgi:hypothetical protein